ncbi:RICIN domain-containing protein [Streptomyces sp. ISL-11]|uniref:RICIN domain-containing protein n=1 Tax=Streptomyces sp. ISL-11 TaxID=2819174 RepID=UPI001BEC4926|nr:RICIN domain-containing protein [Streptomyces sp. ISL-11]MBT2384345.1 RICIN domain-containing protein [Streptomyces sp. ISL-11]
MSVNAKTTYLFRNAKTGLYLTVKGASKDVPADIVQERLLDWPRRASQAWRLEPGQGGADTYRIQNQHSGRYLQVRRYGKEPGVPMVQEHLEESNPAYKSQTWRITNDDDRGSPVINLHSGLLLNARGDVSARGSAVDQWQGHADAAGAAQRWYFEPVGPHGGAKAFDALAGLVVEPSSGGIITAVTSVFKASLEATGGVFGTVSKWVPGVDRTPYIRFDGFRGDEVVRFSQRSRVEAGPRKIGECFPQLPKEFHEGFDFVTTTPKGHRHPYLGVKGDLSVEFSEKGSDDVPSGLYFPPEELGRAGRPLKAVSAAPDGSYYLVFGEKGTVTIDAPGPKAEREVREVALAHVPKEFRQAPDAIASAAVGDEMHYFATKGDHYIVFTLREVVHGPAKILDAYPFLLGLWA